MVKDILRGGLLGLTAGIIAAFFDSFAMLCLQDVYVPLEYPVVIVLINVFFWFGFGCLVGAVQHCFCCWKKYTEEAQQRILLGFFLMPFVLLYGFLGRFSHSKFFSPGIEIFFVFIVLFGFIVFLLRKEKHLYRETGEGLLVPELFAIIALFHVCLNSPQWPWVRAGFNWFFTVDFFTEPDRYFTLLGRYSAFLCGAGVLVIGCCYVFVISKLRISKIKPVSMLALLFVVTVLCAGFCFTLNKMAFMGRYDHVPTLQPTAGDETGPPVILIVLDTLRKRSLDEHPNVFRNLRAFEQESLVFESCIANSAWTLPSHASLFTGLAPREHGSHGLPDSDPWFDGFPPTRPLQENFTTLAEAFADGGYYTAAVVSNFGALHPGYGVSQGFQLYEWSKGIGFAYESLPFKPLVHVAAALTNVQNKYMLPYRKAGDMNDSVAEVLQRLSSGRFFLFINYMDAHDPYIPTTASKRHFFEPFDPYGHVLVSKAAFFLNLITEKYLCHLNELSYKGEIAYLDDQLGLLFERLKAYEVYDKALIVITSDHGELFCDHGYRSHRTPIYEGISRIPLFIKFPYQRVIGTEQRYITLADLYPTILSVCGMPYPETISGRPFGMSEAPIVSEFYGYDIGAHYALYDGRYKYMSYEKGKPNELYDVVADTLEQNDLVDVLPEQARDMSASLADWLAEHPQLHPQEENVKVDYEPVKLREDLKSLGYIQ